MKRFILLLNHDDISLSAYLQHCLARGERLVSVSGNSFTFRKDGPSGNRIAVVTYANDDPDLKMKLQLEDYTYLMKTRGWQVICTGGPEDIFDSKRHVFLRTGQPDIPFPNTSPELAKKANGHELHSCIRCFAMLLILFGFSVFFLGHDLDVLLSSPHILIPCAAAVIFWILSLVWNIRGAFTLKRGDRCGDGFRNYLSIDRAVLFCLISIFCLVLALVSDSFLFPDKSSSTVFGDQRITVYRDEVPLRLEDLGIPAEGIFRSSRLTVRDGFLMSSLYGSDQSFSDAESTRDLSLVSYSVFRSGSKLLLDRIAAQKGAGRYPADAELAAAWNCSEVRSDGQYRLFAYYPDTFLVFSSSRDLSEIDPHTVLEKLLPEN